MSCQQPYVSPEGWHRHQCHFCNFIWEHHDSNDLKHGDQGAHECPSCHRCNWSLGIYDGPMCHQIRSPIMPKSEPKKPQDEDDPYAGSDSVG